MIGRTAAALVTPSPLCISRFTSFPSTRRINHLRGAPMEELNGKVGIVSGAGRLRGIGRATAVALAHLGADVVVTGALKLRDKEISRPAS